MSTPVGADYFELDHFDRFRVQHTDRSHVRMMYSGIKLKKRRKLLRRHYRRKLLKKTRYRKDLTSYYLKHAKKLNIISHNFEK